MYRLIVHIHIFLIGLWSLPSSYALAGPVQVHQLVEVFVSQGCPRSPDLSLKVQNYAQQDGVLLLSYGVTYWDYRGWRDTMAKPEFDARQRDYGRYGGGRIFTPQMVVNGIVQSADYLGAPLDFLAPLNSLGADVIFNMSAGEVVFDISDDSAGLDWTLIAYEAGYNQAVIGAGANTGQTMSYANPVVALYPLNTLEKNDDGYYYIPAKIQSGLSYALIGQRPGTGTVEWAAAWIDE